MPDILIAEDNALLVKMYQRFFEEGGIPDTSIRLAVDGSEAIKQIDTKQPDMLLLDLLMPEVDGFEVLEYVRSKHYDFPVIILSNLSQEIDKKRCDELGVKAYFVKSDMDLSELSDMVKEYL